MGSAIQSGVDQFFATIAQQFHSIKCNVANIESVFNCVVIAKLAIYFFLRFRELTTSIHLSIYLSNLSAAAASLSCPTIRLLSLSLSISLH